MTLAYSLSSILKSGNVEAHHFWVNDEARKRSPYQGGGSSRGLFLWALVPDKLRCVPP